MQQVHADALPSLFRPPFPETFPASLVRQLLVDPHTYIFIGFANGAPAGYIYAQILRREETALRYAWDRLYIHHISVSQAYQRQGIGQALMQTVIRGTKEHRISTIALDVWSCNTKARAFFAAQGFSVYNETMWLHLSGQE